MMKTIKSMFSVVTLICIALSVKGEAVKETSPIAQIYLQYMDKACTNFANSYFTDCEVVYSGAGEFERLKITRNGELAKENVLFANIPRALCAGRGRTAVVFGKKCPKGDTQMCIFGTDGLVASCQRYGEGSNMVETIECQFSSEVSEMLSKDDYAEFFPSTLFGINLCYSMPDFSLLTDDSSVVMCDNIKCSPPRCKDRAPIKVDHSIFTEISRIFEKDSGRMVSFELQCLVEEKNDINSIIERIWSNELLLAGFFGGRDEPCKSSMTCYGFTRIDGIEASLLLSKLKGDETLLKLSVRLPEDFQVRDYRDRRRNGWFDPRILYL